MTKIAAITGGASGIGRGTAKRLLDDGWTVVALDVAEKNLAALRKDFASFGARPILRRDFVHRLKELINLNQMNSAWRSTGPGPNVEA